MFLATLGAETGEFNSRGAPTIEIAESTGITPSDNTRYIPLDQFLASKGRPVIKKEGKCKRPKLISLKDERIDPFEIAQQFYDHSETLQACITAGYSNEKLRDFALRAFSSRCSKHHTLLKYTRFMWEFLEYARSRHPPAPISGEGATPVIAEWLDRLLERGANVPHDGRHALTVFSEALGVPMPLKHPAVNVAQRAVRTKPQKHAPAAPLEFATQLEMHAADDRNDKNTRFFCPALCLLIFASLRFSDAIEIQEFWTTKTAVCGTSIDQKSPKRALITWAAPRRGFRTNGAWVNPVWAYWEKYKPLKGNSHYLFSSRRQGLGNYE